MTGSYHNYYFWKWADNDLPGPPAEVHAALLRGEFHPALQTFDARPLLKKLKSAAAKGRKRGEEWDWQLTPSDEPRRARFVFVTCPSLNESKAREAQVDRDFFPLALSGCDEQNVQLIPSLLPKLNSFVTGQFPYETAYDIALDDLPFLLRQLRANSFAIVTNRWNNYVQCSKCGHRFRVEWRKNYDLADHTRFDQWAAYPPNSIVPEPFAPAGVVENREEMRRREIQAYEDLLRYSDTLRIFQTFLRGEPRPMHYRWRNINHIVS
jgi:hypothetical protein